jgi:cytoskeleton-associated protein 5
MIPQSKQVMNTAFQILEAVAKSCKARLPDRCGHMVVSSLADKVSDVKLRNAACSCLSQLCESNGTNFITLRVCQATETAKNPKVQSEVLGWLGETVLAFGLKIAVKPHVAYAKKMLAATNAGVRTAAISFLGVLRQFVGPSLLSLFEDEKPALLTAIKEKFTEVESTKPPAPTRFEATDAPADETGSAAGDKAAAGSSKAGAAAGGKQAPAVDPMDELFPRVDLTEKIKPTLLTELEDKNWKVRAEALESLIASIKEAKRILPNLGDIANAVKLRLADSNKNQVATALGVVSMLGEALGPVGARKFLNLFMQEVFTTLGDAKDSVRLAAVAAMDAWHKETGIEAFVDLEYLPTSLTSGKPNEQKELCQWLAAKLEAHEGAIPALKNLVKPLFACLEDRSGDVRKAAQTLALPIARSVGLEKLKKACGQLKPTSQPAIMAALDKIDLKPVAKSGSSSSVTAAAPAAATATSADSADAEADKAGKGTAATAAAATAAAAAAAAGKGGVKKGASKAEVAGKQAKKPDAPPPDEQHLLMNDKKPQREKDDKTLKVCVCVCVYECVCV